MPADTPPAPDPGAPATPGDAQDGTVHTRWWQGATWVPSLYFIEGLPYVVVNILSVVMYKTLGVSNSEIAFYTSWLGLIWAFKALWSPLVDGVWTKRSWTLAMQALTVPVIIGVGFCLPLPDFVQVTLVLFSLVGVLSATHDIAADGFYMLGLSEGLQSAFVGIRSTFWRVALVAGEGGLVVLAGVLGERLGLVEGWTATLVIAATVFGVGFVYHFFMLPRPAADRPRDGGHALANTAKTFGTFVAKDGLMAGVLFLVYFRFAENHMAKIVGPFLLDGVEVGGLGLTVIEVGVAKGTVGVICLVVGGIVGGFAIYRHGLRAWLWPMVIALNVPDLVYVYLAWAQPDSFRWVAALIGVESFGYGFGFAAYLMFMIRLAQGEFKTAHYAFGTGIMALAAWAAQVWSGAAQELLGYDGFFTWVCVLTLPGIWVAWLIEVPASFGRGDASPKASSGLRPMRKAPYLTGVYLNLVLGSLIVAFGVQAGEGPSTGVVLGGLMIAGAGPVLTMALLAFNMWAALPAPHAMHRPGWAAGLLLVPGINLYWVFRAFRGFAVGHNAWAEASGAPPVSVGLFTAFAALTVLSGIPWAGAVFAAANVVVVGLVVSAAVDAVNELAAVTAAGTPRAGGSGPLRRLDQ